jgi:hypothetical protein
MFPGSIGSQLIWCPHYSHLTDCAPWVRSFHSIRDIHSILVENTSNTWLTVDIHHRQKLFHVRILSKKICDFPDHLLWWWKITTDLYLNQHESHQIPTSKQRELNHYTDLFSMEPNWHSPIWEQTFMGFVCSENKLQSLDTHHEWEKCKHQVITNRFRWSPLAQKKYVSTQI